MANDLKSTHVTSGEKAYKIVKTTKRPIHINERGHNFELPDQGGVTIKDPGVAQAINDRYGDGGHKEVIVREIPNRENGHRYFWNITKPMCSVLGCQRLPHDESGLCEAHKKEQELAEAEV